MRHGPGLLVLSLVLVPTLDVGQATPHKYLHPGTIVDAYSRKGIIADAHAFASQSPTNSSRCPTYPNPLDTQKSSSPSGNFSFHIDAQISGYLAVYCEQGYAPRTETTNDNSTDNTRVQPDPITLYPTSHPGTSATEVAGVAIGADLDALHANFSYYDQSSPASFAKAVDSPAFSDADRGIISVVLQKQQRFSPERPQLERWPRQNSADDPKTAFAAIIADLNHVRSDLVYYARSDEGGYFGALRSAFSPDESKVIEAVRTRSAPFGRPGPLSMNQGEEVSAHGTDMSQPAAPVGRVSIPSCEIAITSPKPGTDVGVSGTVKGTARIPSNSHLWILAHKKTLNGWWPQGGGGSR
ncbi:MAG TPA: hypothetical protein VI386_05930 [Candidatus Sulfotelmatobacter sp.]